MTTDVLRLDSISKTFGSVRALSDVSFTVRPGEVHALVGENGAGKSTLMAIAAGALAPDAGSVEIGGRRLSRVAPAAAQELGLAVVYQHATTLDDLTVRENLLVALPEDRRPAGSEAAEWVRGHLAAVGCTARAGDRVEELGQAQRQLVEIARALALESQVLVLDEPTESLTEAESELLFEQISALRTAGAGIVYISHRFPEVQRIADRISVLRDGRLRGTFPASDVTEDDILELIVGREVDHVFPVRPDHAPTDGAPLLEVSGLSGARFSGVDLGARRGEIIGLAGVEGNGQRDFLRALAGLTPSVGRISIDSREVGHRSPASVAASGVVHLPGDRHVEGLFLPLTVRENTTALVLSGVSRGGVIDARREREVASDAVSSLAIRTPGTESPVSSLSGGNQQKVLFARSLAAEPSVLLADEPTRGVDVGARVEIYRLLREFADSGKVVVALSSDAVELAGLCDRVLVFSRGQVVRELTGDELTERAITGAAITARTSRVGTGRAEGSSSDRRAGLRRLAGGDYAPSLVLGVLLVALMALAYSRNPLFLSARNLSGLLLLTAILVLVSVGQLTTLLVGSIDLSVGPLVGLVIVIMSFFAVDGAGSAGLLQGALVSVLVGAVVGLVNGVAVRFLRLPAVIATLVAYIVLQGLALLLRPNPEGYIDSSTISLLQAKLGPVPVAFLVTLAVVVAAEYLLRRSRAGITLRAVGSDEIRARRLGAPVARTVVLAHVVCAAFAALGGVVLCSLVGVGQAGVGAQYTLTSITAVVLGGASIFGGRGSYVGALLGALLIQTVISATSFLNLDQAWQEWLPGLLILLGAAIFSGARRRALVSASSSQE
ncbi:MAG: ATP-binding cassette domain-containing protein [Frankiales bacterium]|nr:ATP-binding cassette domain-containing protein [Frankiales bacterium]